MRWEQSAAQPGAATCSCSHGQSHASCAAFAFYRTLPFATQAISHQGDTLPVPCLADVMTMIYLAYVLYCLVTLAPCSAPPHLMFLSRFKSQAPAPTHVIYPVTRNHIDQVVEM